jgi:hypothetical protein
LFTCQPQPIVQRDPAVIFEKQEAKYKILIPPSCIQRSLKQSSSGGELGGERGGEKKCNLFVNKYYRVSKAKSHCNLLLWHLGGVQETPKARASAPALDRAREDFCCASGVVESIFLMIKILLKLDS